MMSLVQLDIDADFLLMAMSLAWIWHLEYLDENEENA